MIIKKRGLSDVVATVLIIMLTVVAVAIIAGFVVPYVSNSLSKGGECVQYKDYFKFQESLEFKGKTYHYNCYNQTSVQHGASVSTLKIGSVSGDNVTLENKALRIGLNLVFLKSDTGESTTVKIRNGDLASLGIGGVRMLNKTLMSALKVPENGGVQTYVYNSDKIYDSVEVYPVLENGRVCDKTDSIKLVKCEDNLNVE